MEPVTNHNLLDLERTAVAVLDALEQTLPGLLGDWGGQQATVVRVGRKEAVEEAGQSEGAAQQRKQQLHELDHEEEQENDERDLCECDCESNEFGRSVRALGWPPGARFFQLFRSKIPQA